MNYQKVLADAVRRKWKTPALKEWWWTKFSAARRMRTRRLSEAQNHRCAFCSRETFLNEEERLSKPFKMSKGRLATLEHVNPQSQGGNDNPANAVMSCDECNSNRGTMDAWEFYEVRSDPKKWLEFLRRRKKMVQLKKEEANPERLAKKDARRAKHAYNMAVACMISPEFQAWFLEAKAAMDEVWEEAAPRKAKNQRRRNSRKALLLRAEKAAAVDR